jgi:LPS-assembly lipoprotein
MMRRLSFLPLLLLLSACGLHSLYGGGSGSPVSGLLRSVQVGPIAGQPGWLVRTKLIDRLGDAQSAQAQYRLDVTLDDNITSYGLRADRAATQERRTLRARYQLVDLSNGAVVLDETAGSDASVDVSAANMLLSPRSRLRWKISPGSSPTRSSPASQSTRRGRRTRSEGEQSVDRPFGRPAGSEDPLLSVSRA